MKNAKFSILGLSLLLLVASCKKDDLQKADPTTSEATSITAADSPEAGWQSAATWETVNQQSFSVQYFTIDDANITADVADQGLVLVFKKNGSAVNTLPFEEPKEEGNVANDTESNSANYWYHQVTEGSVLISRDVYDASTAPGAANSFKYFIITPEKLQSLEKDGYTTEKLMSLSYADAAALLEPVK